MKVGIQYNLTVNFMNNNIYYYTILTWIFLVWNKQILSYFNIPKDENVIAGNKSQCVLILKSDIQIKNKRSLKKKTIVLLYLWLTAESNKYIETRYKSYNNLFVTLTVLKPLHFSISVGSVKLIKMFNLF